MKTGIVRTVLFAFGAGYWTCSILWTVRHSGLGDQVKECAIQPSLNLHSSSSSDPVAKRWTLSMNRTYDLKSVHNSSLSEGFPSNQEDTNHIENAILSATSDADVVPVRFHNVSIIQMNMSSTTDKAPTKRTFSPLWWKRRVKLLARAWFPRSIESWCELEEYPTPMLLRRGESAEGMIYIKTYKASSSTCEGIAQSIAHQVGKRQWHKQKTIARDTVNNKDDDDDDDDAVCRAYTRHEFADNRMHSRRNQTHSLLWSFVRNPAARDLSHVYHFEIGRNQRVMSPDDIQKKIEGHIKGRQTRYLVPLKTSTAPLWPRHELRRNATDLILYLKSAIFENYDFLGLTERMSESLACMVLLWDLKVEDVIVLNSKQSGGFDDGGGINHTCTVIPKPPKDMPPSLEEYFSNRHALWNADVLIYHAANASLELTIDALGRDRVQNVAQTIEHLQQVAHDACIEEAVFPCSPNGTFQPELAKESCYVQDAGCGYKCVQRVLASSSSGVQSSANKE